MHKRNYLIRFIVNRYVAGLLVLICLVIGINVLYKNTIETKKTVKPEIINTNLPSLQLTFGNIKSYLSTGFKNLEQTGPDTTNVIGFPLAGYNFSVLIPYAPSSSLSYIATNNSNESQSYQSFQKVLPGLINIFQKAGFANLKNDSNTKTSLETNLFFARSSDVCQVTSYNLLDIGCATSSSISQTASSAKPLMDAYYNADQPSGSQTIAMPVIRASSSAGYEIASIDVYGSNGETKLNLFKSSSDAWRVINLSWYNDPSEDGNIQPNCEDFESNQSVRLAFNGLACYDSTSKRQSVVD
jgi:hypothetical protein